MTNDLQLVSSLGRFRQWVLPVGGLRELIRRGPEVMPVIRQRLDLFLESEDQGIEKAYPEAFFCYHLLGIAPDATWYDWFDRFFRSDPEKIEAGCGSVTEAFTRAILAAIANREDLPAFCEWIDSLVQDEQVCQFAKIQTVNALFNLVGDGCLDDSIAVEWVRTWLQQRESRVQDEWSAMIVADLIDFGGKDLKELALDCFRRNQIDDSYVDAQSLDGMSDDRQFDFLRKRATTDREMLADPSGYMESWHGFAWTTDSLDPQSATYARVPDQDFFRRSQPTDAQFEEWLSAIDQSNFETYPKTAIENLARHTAAVTLPLVTRVRNGIESAEQDAPIASNGPYLAATLLAHNTNRREVLFQDSELFLDILDLTSERRFEWFGDTIDSHLIEALVCILAGRTEPILQRISDTSRSDVDLASLISFFPISVYFNFMSREECTTILRELWGNLNREQLNSGIETLLTKQAIADATCLLALPDDNPLVRDLRENQIEYFSFSEVDAKECQANSAKARQLIQSVFLSPVKIGKVIEQSCQFGRPAIDARPLQIESPAAIRPSISSATIRNESLRVGRNDPCPCGSGKKFKKCCHKTN